MTFVASAPMGRTVRDCLRAMRLYVSPVFLRENPLAFLAILYVALCFGFAFLLHHDRLGHDRFWHDSRYTISPVLAPIWWVSLYASFSAISLHYWRQIRPTSTYLLVRLQRAEYHGVLAVGLISIFLLALPPLSTGAPTLNCFALEAIGLFLWSGPRPASRAEALRGVMTSLGIVRAIGFFFLLVPRMQNYLFSVPWYVAVVIIIACLGMALRLYRFRDYRLAPETPRDLLASAPETLSTPVERVASFILWRPSRLVRLPLADPVHTGSPIAVALLVVGSTLIFGCLAEFIAWIADGVIPSPIALRHRLPNLSRQSLFLIGVSLSAWMTQHGDWPFLLTLGPYGEKRIFARAVYRLHLQRALQAGLIAGTMIALTTWFDERMALGPALAAGWACGLFLTGASCLPTLAFLVPRFNRPPTIAVLNIGAMLLGMQFATTLVMQTGFWWRWLLTPGSLLFALLCFFLIPPRLAAQDWPIEPPR